MFKILVIEDESIISRDICRIVSGIENTSSFVADTYDTAVEIIDSIIPDLILLDIKLYEDEDAGLRIAKYINAKYRIPIIFLSGYATEKYLQKAKKEMPVTFITKPVDSKQLHVTVLMAIREEASFKFRHLTFHGRRIDKLAEAHIDLARLNDIPLSFEKINPDEIEIIKSFNHIKRNTVLLKLISGSYLVVSNTINNIMKLLPSSFVKVHNSFIVNKRYVVGVMGKDCVKVGNETISFGTEFKRNRKIEFLSGV